jgi:hypothetical protein
MKRLLISLGILLVFAGCKDNLLFSDPSLQGRLNDEYVWRATSFSATVVSDTITVIGYRGNNVLLIKIPATAIGDYGLNSNSIASIGFVQDGMTYSTMNNGSNGLGEKSDGNIDLKEYNTEEKYIAGEFWFTGYSVDGTSSVNFTIGRMFRAPIVPSAP